MNNQCCLIPTPSGLISPGQVKEKISDLLLLDVRTPAEFEEMHIDSAVLHPLTELNGEHVQTLARGKSACVVICRSGGRAKQAADKLSNLGHKNVHVMTGGMLAWQRDGLPIVTGRKTISLERQVRIAAGALVLVGSILGWVVNPAWTALPAFIGAGLVFAGVTDTCGLAMVLARMPWNQGSKA